jgi:hypothetical protein
MKKLKTNFFLLSNEHQLDELTSLHNALTVEKPILTDPKILDLQADVVGLACRPESHRNHNKAK